MTAAALQIVVTAGTGTAPTPLASFDAALHAAGVADFNLVRLSSLIPPGSSVHAPDRWGPLPGRWGDRLYVVYAEHRVSVPGRRACAGLGWVQDLDTGAGMLVEHHSDGSEDDGDREDGAAGAEAQVVARIRATLGDLAVRRPGRYGEQQWCTATIVCEQQPVTAVVVAAFKAEPW